VAVDAAPNESTAASGVALDPVGKAVVVAVAVVATLGLLPWLGSSMFAAEGASLYSAHLSWSGLWAQSQHVDRVLLPYYVVLHFWVMVSGNIEWVRALSLFAYFGTIVVVGFIGLRIAGRWCGVISSVLTATSALLVEKAMDARPYLISTFVVALCAVVLIKWLDDSRVRWMWAFSALTVCAAAMQMFSLLAPLAMLAGVLLVRPKLIAQRVRSLLGPLAVLAAALWAWMLVCVGQVGQVNWIANESTGSRLFDEVRGPLLGQLYDFLLFVIVVVAVSKLAIGWNRDVPRVVVQGISRDRDILALTIGWAIAPTIALSLASFIHPIYSSRYVAASAPGVALLVAFLSVRAFSMSSIRSGLSRQTGTRLLAAGGATAVLVLVLSYVSAASAQQEDLQGPARYIAQHIAKGDVFAVPDHAITAAVDYYTVNDGRPIPLWPQLGDRQPFVEGLDLSLHPSMDLPRRVWLLSDGSVPVVHFETMLEQVGYLLEDTKRFNGSALLRFDSNPVSFVVAPSNGATLSAKDAVLVAVTPDDWVHVNKVHFMLKSASSSARVIGTGTHSSYGWFFLWDTRQTPNGTYTLQSVATNTMGNDTYSSPIMLKVHH
jgi:mannosyltransferase